MAAKASSDSPCSSSNSLGKEDDVFEDAQDVLNLPLEVDLTSGINEARIALDLFLNNHFEESKSRMAPLSDRSIYHALGYGTVMYLQAAVTLEVGHIQKAVEVVRASVDVCNKQRKKTSFTGSFNRVGTKVAKRQYYNTFTDDQAHAELCYAECLLERAFLMFVQDENLMAFIKGGLKIRECYRSYKECWKILQFREWKDHNAKETFESGVRMGVGAFNLLISMLPSKILKLLEFIGFSGNKKGTLGLPLNGASRRFGLNQLTKAAALQGSLRSPLGTLILLFYYIFASLILGVHENENIEEAKRLIAPCMKKYPNSAMFLFFSGRISLISGNFEEAMSRYHASIDSQSEWVNVHHMCYWELLWSHCLQGDWLMAMKYAERLALESKWSKATYYYLKAAFLLQYGDSIPEGNSDDVTEHVDKLLETIPNLIQRFAGKALPVEKFALKKSKRYFDQKKRLTLPALEIIFVWNGFRIVAWRPDFLDKMIELIELKINEIVAKKDELEFFHDDYCLAMLLKGVCQRYRGHTFQAKMCFNELLENQKNIKCDLYMLPWCEMELAGIYLKEDDLKQTRKHLDRAKAYKGYSLESRLHFRMHAMTLHLRERERGGNDGASVGEAGSFAEISSSDNPEDLDIFEEQQSDSALATLDGSNSCRTSGEVAGISTHL